jgi:EmrB/QacA subfamily drug resistance transporter
VDEDSRIGTEEDLMQSLASKPVAFPVKVFAPRAGATDLEIASTRLSAFGLFSVLVGTFLSVTDAFIVNVALPTIGRELQGSAEMLQFVVAGYAMPYALLLVVGGRIGDAVGRRRAFIVGMVAFTLISVLCGIAPSIEWLVMMRVLQGAAAALMAPQVLSTIQATLVADHRVRALGMFSATVALASLAGQIIGGALISANLGGMGWRPIFLVNVPIGLVGVLLARRYVPETRSPEPATVDVRGTVLLTATVASVLVPLIAGRSLDWPYWSIGLLIAAPFLGVAFLMTERGIERSGGTPLVPPSLLAVASMRRGLLVVTLYFSAFGGFTFAYPLSMQGAAHLSAMEAGGAFACVAVGFLIASLTSARLVAQFGHRVMAAGLAIGCVGVGMLATVLISLWPNVPALLMAPSMLVAGLGWGLVMSPLFGIILASVPHGSVGAGSGVLATTQQISLALGVASLGSLFLAQAPDFRLGSLGALLLVLAAIAVLHGLAAVVSLRLQQARP